MALIKCTECGREVSSRAESCPGCGAKITTAKGAIKTAFRYVVYAGFALVLFIVFKAAFLTSDALQR